MNPVAPWAAGPASARLAAIEAALPHDAVALLQAAADAAEAHVAAVDESALLLYAGGNVPTPLGARLHHQLLSGQPSMGYPGDKYQAGLEDLDTIEVAVSSLVAACMGARYAEIRPSSATLANLAVYTAFAEPGDTIAVLPDWAGGHLSHHAVGAAGVRGLRVVELPYSVAELDVDLEALAGTLGREQPKLVVIGASLMLRPHRVAEIAAVAHDFGALLVYDGSHVAGLLAEGRFQQPLADGADLLTFSTYKSFGGPSGGVIAGNDAELMARASTAVYPGLTANYDIARLLPLGAAAVEHHLAAGAYADAAIANAQALGAALHAQGLPVLGAARGFTSSHHLALDARGLGGGPIAAQTLAAVRILLSEIGCPDGEDPDPRGAIRIGLQTLTRQGFVEPDMPAVAGAIADALLERRAVTDIRSDVGRLRRRHSGTRFGADGQWLPLAQSA